MKKILISLNFVLLSAFVFAQTSQISVLSAIVKDKVISNAEVIFQKNGETSITVFTDNSGKVSIPEKFRNDENVILIIKTTL